MSNPREKSRSKLGTYRDKRDAARTNEPMGTEPAVSGEQETTSGRFVVHLHDATRLHYDLRIEMGGVLKSFPVPKGPSLDPDVKHLALQTEDHPIEYLEFEGVIPEGNYGAGAMIVWDRGTIRYLDGTAEAGLRRGKIDFTLSGYKLRGRFALVKLKGRSSDRNSKGNEWFLIKKQDAYARADRPIVDQEPQSILSGLTVVERAKADEIAKVIEADAATAGATLGDVDGRKIVPMLCKTEPPPLSSPDWIYELKLDGVRIIADKRGDDVVLSYREPRRTLQYPEVESAVRSLPFERLVLDGEIVAFDENGRPSFQRVARRIQARERMSPVSRLTLEVPVVYLVFDVLAIGPYDTTKLPLFERKRLVSHIIRGRGILRMLDHLEGDGQSLLDLCEREKLEGIVAKRRDSAYQRGPRRFSDWRKLKCERDEEFVVVGFTAGEGARRRMGALDVASYDGGKLEVRGKVGSGLTDALIDDLLERLTPLIVKKCAAHGELERAPKGRTFVKPEVVISVHFTGWTDEGRLRHPVVRGIRDDVSPGACMASPRSASPELLRAEELKPEDRDRPGAGASGAASSDALAPQTPAPTTRSRVQFTNRKKVFWPGDGLTKGDLCDYYSEIAPAILPYLKDRPVALVRYPDGIEGKNFFQWNVPQGTPSWVRTIQLPSSDDDRTKLAFIVNDKDTLLYIANLGAIPIHILASRERSLGFCDFLTIDFDLGEGTMGQAITLALSLRELLTEIDLVGFPKTSGQSGLHVLVPLGEAAPFEVAKKLVELLGRLLETRHPSEGTMERRVAKRGKRVYIDTGQTGPSRMIVAPYSVRAHAGATVSTPLSWDEVNVTLAPARWTLRTVPARYERMGDPMNDLLATPTDLMNALTRLEPLVRGLE